MITLRPATIEDAACLYAWRCDPVTAAQSFQAPPPSLEVHTAWLARTLAAGVDLLIAERDGAPVGTARIDPAGDADVELHLTIAPDARGQRLATPVIEAACTRARDHGARRALAHIKPENIASQRAFLSAGFVFVGEHTADAWTAYRYQRELHATWE